MNQIHVLHITCDYPDAINANKTMAVSNLVCRSSRLRHTVLSLNRGHTPFYCKRQGNLFSIKYKGLPYGLLLKNNLQHTFQSLKKIIDFDFDIIHAHKFSIEGILASLLSLEKGIPFVTTVRGHTDLAIIRAKPHYRKLYRAIASESSHIFFLAPWTITDFSRLLGMTPSSISCIPNITSIPPMHAPITSTKFATTVNFTSNIHRSKNLNILLKALSKVVSKPDYARYGLDLYTTPESIPKQTQALLSHSILREKIRIKQLIPNADFVEQLHKYIAFVRPSFPETFGMVYIESMRAGVPIMHAKNTAIDGYFKDFEFIKKVSPHSSREICQALIQLIDHQDTYKANLHRQVRSGTFSFLNEEAITGVYSDQIIKTCSSRKNSSH